MPTLVSVVLCLLANAPSRAEQLFNDGTAAYDQGNYEEALDAFSRSYKLSSLPAVLFDIAQCDRQLGRWREAEGYYRRYLRAVPRAPNREQVDGYLQDVHSQAEQEAAVPIPALAAPAAPAAPLAATSPQLVKPVTFPPKIWTTGGVGAGLLVLGIALYAGGKSVAGRDDPLPCEDGLGGTCHSLTAGQAGLANGLGYSGETGLAVGGVTLVAALIWAIADAGARSPRRSP